MRKNRNLIRIISLVLAMILCLSLLPLTSMMAGAQEIPEETVEYKEPESEEASSEEESEEESEETSSEAESEETTSEAESEETSEPATEGPSEPTTESTTESPSEGKYTAQVENNVLYAVRGNEKYSITVSIGDVTFGSGVSASVVITPVAASKDGGVSKGIELEGVTISPISFLLIDGSTEKAVEEPKNAGTYKATAKVTFNGTDEHTISKSFKVLKKAVTVSGIKVKDKEYDGTNRAEVDLSEVVLAGKVEGSDLTLSVNNAVFPKKAASETPYTVKLDPAQFVLGGKDAANYTVSEDLSQSECTECYIRPRSISSAKVVLGNALFYNGSKQTQSIKSVTIESPKLTLVKGDYVISGNTATAVGSNYKLTITGKGNYKDSVEVPFGIYPNPDKIDGNVYELGNGKITLNVENGTSVKMESGLSDFVKCLTTDELQTVVGGTTVAWNVYIQEATELSDTNKTKLKTAAGAYTIYGKYYDITVYKSVDGGSNEKMATMPFGVEFSMKVPSSVPALKSGQKLLVKVVRGHQGTNYTASSLEATLSSDKKRVTFSSDKFSEFAFASKPSSSVATGDERPVGLVAVVLAVAVCTLGGLLYWENKARKSV